MPSKAVQKNILTGSTHPTNTIQFVFTGRDVIELGIYCDFN
jgi:hypothetical protein